MTQSSGDPRRIVEVLLLCALLGGAVRAANAHFKEHGDVEALRQAAEMEVRGTRPCWQPAEETVFRARGTSLQALNPEISVAGDFWAGYREDAANGDRHPKFNSRGLGLHLESYLDPYSRFKAAVPFNEAGAELGEAYFIRYGLIPHVNLTLGKFRQQFGVVNRWHKHGLDQFDFPLALRRIFGEGGLNQVGASLEWTLPSRGRVSRQIDLQVTNGMNPTLFAGNARQKPSVLTHYKGHRQISDAAYLELGASGLVGWNDHWLLTSGAVAGGTRMTAVYGADLTFFWEPTGRMRYRNFLWRTEGYGLSQAIVAPDGSGEDTINAWGLYSYAQAKVSRTVEVGVRGDFYRPDTKAYGDSVSPHAVTRSHPYQWQFGPYLTWQQSPFVKVRFEYDHLATRGLGAREDAAFVQVIFAAGPHKHERY